jgi:hypothetical protein
MPKAETKIETPKRVEELSRDEQIKYWYQRGKGSIQDIARIYNVTVHEVLVLIGEAESSNVFVAGDLIDEQEAGPSAQMNHGKSVRIDFTTN